MTERVPRGRREAAEPPSVGAGPIRRGPPRAADVAVLERRGTGQADDEHPRQQRVQRCPQPGVDDTDAGDVQEQRPPDGRGRGEARVDEVVVVPLEAEQSAVLGVDAVQHDRVQLGGAVGHDLADVVRTGGPQHGEVAGVEDRLHADAMGDDERQPPGGHRHHQRERERPTEARQRRLYRVSSHFALLTTKGRASLKPTRPSSLPTGSSHSLRQLDHFASLCGANTLVKAV